MEFVALLLDSTFAPSNTCHRLPYGAEPLDEAGSFFAKMTGLLFGFIVMGYLQFGVSAEAFTKQTILFHTVGSALMFQNANGSEGAFTPWVWQLQIVLGAVFAFWGVSTLKGDKKKA